MTQFAAVLSATGKQMDNAVANSVDGTIVSVARDCCQGIDSGCNLQAFMTSWAANARRELKKTPDQLKDPKTGKYVLKEAGVVDSGGQGFVYMVEGMSMAANGDKAMGAEAMSDPATLLRNKIAGAEEPQQSVNHDVSCGCK